MPEGANGGAGSHSFHYREADVRRGRRKVASPAVRASCWLLNCRGLGYDARVGTVESYLELAERPNTVRSYAAAVRHFETEWRGLLPASAEMIAEYLATFAPTLSVNTLEARLAGLARWHQDHGFPDPTRAPLVRRVLKGIRTAHNKPEKQARPVEFQQLELVCTWMEERLQREDVSSGLPQDRVQHLRRARDTAMLLIGFWRGFRSDELTSLRFEHVTVRPGVDMSCFIPRSKPDRQAVGRSFQCPALSRLCPVTAFERWKTASGLDSGPVFRRIDRWGHVSGEAMAAGSVVPWLRDLFHAAGVGDAASFSSHSLRRGFANWAKSSGWDLKELMEYVGWRDVNSALRYLDRDNEDLAAKFESGLARGPAPASMDKRTPASDPQGTNVVPLRPVRS